MILQGKRGTTFAGLSIRVKVVLLAAASTACALLLASVSLILVLSRDFKATFVRELRTISEVAARNLTAAVFFENKADAEELMRSLSEAPDVLAACIHTQGRTLFAEVQFDAALPDAGCDPGAADRGYVFEGDSLFTFVPIELDGETIGTLRVRSSTQRLTDRVVTLAVINGIVVLLAFAGVVVAAARFVRRVTQPVLSLASVAESVTAGRDYSRRAVQEGDDEVGQLVQAFNEMLGVIEQHDRELQSAVDHLTTARLAGMAEVAATVLHNIGNVLNSVNVSASRAQSKIKDAQVATLVEVAELVAQHDDDLPAFLSDDPRGAALPQFLAEMGSHLRDAQTTAIKELDLLQKGVEHIRGVISTQQSYSHVAAVVEAVDLCELLDDAIALSGSRLESHEIEIVKNYEGLPVVMVDRHKLFQIVVNLLRNAKHALFAGRSTGRVMTLGVTLRGDDRVQVTVEDNGQGIRPEDLARVFQLGFTTKKDGHGFGLHHGAVTAAELGGALSVHSDGLGTGARFTLELPLEPVRQENAA